MREHMEDSAARLERARLAENVTGLSVVGGDQREVMKFIPILVLVAARAHYTY